MAKILIKRRKTNTGRIIQIKNRKTTSAQILPTMEIVSTGYNPLSVSAPRRIASLPEIANYNLLKK
jgi:hypothetical protein